MLRFDGGMERSGSYDVCNVIIAQLRLYRSKRSEARGMINRNVDRCARLLTRTVVGHWPVVL